MEIIKENNKVYINDEKGNQIAYVLFPNIKDGVVEIITTKVDPSLQGQGVASKLMQEAYTVIKSQNLKAKLTCSYAIKWFEKHQDCQDIVI